MHKKNLKINKNFTFSGNFSSHFNWIDIFFCLLLYIYYWQYCNYSLRFWKFVLIIFLFNFLWVQNFCQFWIRIWMFEAEGLDPDLDIWGRRDGSGSWCLRPKVWIRIHSLVVQGCLPHTWSMHSFKPGGTFCDHCGTILYGITNQGMKCEGTIVAQFPTSIEIVSAGVGSP